MPGVMRLVRVVYSPERDGMVMTVYVFIPRRKTFCLRQIDIVSTEPSRFMQYNGRVLTLIV